MMLGLAMASLFLLSAFERKNSPEYASVMSEDVYFPGSLLGEMMARTGCDGIRFYKVEVAGGGASLLAVSTSGGADMAVEGKSSTKYQLFEGVDGAMAIISPMPLTAARLACANLGEAAFAVTFATRDLQDILDVEGTKGVKLLQSHTPGGENTLTASSASVSEGSIIGVSNSLSISSPSPCPSACGSDPASNYLLDLSQ